MWDVGVRAGDRDADRQSVLGWESEDGVWGFGPKLASGSGPRVLRALPLPEEPGLGGTDKPLGHLSRGVRLLGSILMFSVLPHS